MAPGCFSRIVTLLVLACIAAVLLLQPGCGSTEPTQAPAAIAVVKVKAAPGPAAKIADPRLPYAFQFTPQVIAGAAPEDAAAFQALRDLGVKTIISVDGATPDVAGAEKFGLTYIHLPFGYDGVPVERQQEIAKAILAAPGNVYIHCHHGKHRGASGAASACVVAGLMDNAQALDDMKTMQTGENYLGLWAATREAKPVDPDTLRAMQVVYQSAQPIPALAASMVLIDQHNDNLTLSQKSGWRTPANHPDIDPPHEALQVRELFTELQRTADFAKRPADFQQWAKEAEASAQKLEDALRDWQKTPAAGNADAPPPAEIDTALNDLGHRCMVCHKVYRNIPQKTAAK